MADAAYNRDVDKALRKQYREVTYIPHSDCYLVSSKVIKAHVGVCDATGREVVPAVYKKCSFEKGPGGEALIFAMGPSTYAPSPDNRVYSVTRGEILRIGSSEPQLIEGGYITSYLKPIYNLSGDIVMDCQQTAIQPVREGTRIVGYRVAVRENGADRLWVCSTDLSPLFVLEGQGYLWKVAQTRDANGLPQWICSKGNGVKDIETLAFAPDGTPIQAAQPQAVAAAPTQAPTAEKPAPKPAAAIAQAKPAQQSTRPVAQASTPTPQRRYGASSDVDRGMPIAKTAADNSFAVIICNEDYAEVAPVPYAKNDGEILAKYCQSTLGIPESNIRLVKNATLNQMKRQLHWLTQIADAYGSDAKIIFYYSGHGLPDEASRDAYLLPVDGYPADMSTNLKLSDLYDSLSKLKVGQVTMLMDACFSGAQRDKHMLVDARGVARQPKPAQPSGKLVVLSAAQADETAYAYEGQDHGLFTYFLLKKLKESGSHVTLGELADYVTDQVKKTSLTHNNKIQTPSLTVSREMSESWRNKNL